MTTAARKERGPYARTALRREQIARASLEIVVELGHENLTTAEVARRAGSSEATALYHFPSKDHLLVAALEHQDQLDQTELADHPLRGIEELDGALDLDSFRGFAQATVARGRILRLHVAL
ncbi:MAG: TetR family transcriptional regulator, partial [Cellulomonadaceae bacterium]|nr:TetR family transcriptional regulator [Cellulomonadaceae bacterium]